MTPIEKLEDDLIRRYNELPETATAEESDTLLEQIAVIQAAMLAAGEGK